MSAPSNTVNIFTKTPEMYRKDTSIEIRSAILHQVLNLNSTQAEASRMFNVPTSTVGDIVKHFKKTGLVVPSPKSGRKKKIDDRTLRWLKRTIVRDPRQTKETIMANMAIKVSRPTLKKYLDEMDLHS